MRAQPEKFVKGFQSECVVGDFQLYTVPVALVDDKNRREQISKKRSANPMAKRTAMTSLGTEYSAHVVWEDSSVLRRLYNSVDAPKKRELLKKHLACAIERVETYGRR